MKTTVRGFVTREKLLLPVLWLFVTLLVLELGLMFLLGHAELVAWSTPLLNRLRSVYIHQDWEVLQGSEDRIRYDSELLYLLKPGPHQFDNREFRTTVTANSAGLRDDESSLDGPEIVVIGDSYAMGWGVEAEETFAQQIEASTGLKVLNASMSSYGTGRELLLLERVDTARTRAVVVQYFLNDFAENLRFAQAESPPAAMSLASFQRWIGVLRDQARYRPFDYSRSLFGSLDLHPELGAVSKQEVAKTLLRVLRTSEELSSMPTFFVQIDPWANPKHNLSTTLKELIDSSELRAQAALNLKVIDLGGVLTPSDFYLLDPHLRPQGHRKIAERIVEALESARLVSGSEPRTG